MSTLAREFAKSNIKQVWKQFVLSGKIQEGLVRTVIAESWVRSREAGVNHLDGCCLDLLSREEVQALREERQQLLDIARPIMDTLFKCVQGSGFVVVLITETGRILETIGDPDILEMAGTLNFLPGANWSEESVGTNAIGTSLAIGSAIQVSGAEHYCSKHHAWTCSGAPIHDPSGKIIGCLNMSGTQDRVHSHTLGMIVAAVGAIENQLRKEEAQQRLAAAHKHLTAVVGSISEGLLSVDSEARITHVNSAAAKIIGMLPSELVGKPVLEVFGESRQIRKVLETGQSCLEEELVMDAPRGRIHCTFTATAITDEARTVGAVVTLREIKQVHQIVNQMAGAQARFRFGDIIGESPQISDVIRKAKMAAQSPSTVLFMGESGTGKEVFAQAIHNASARRNGPFVAVNCAAMPRELIQSELFGYCEGAFTGARRGGRPGKFELASGGTLFLDEVGDMPLDMQVNLLRVLQEKNVVRVGGDKAIPVDVRVIAATNKNLFKEVEKGNFRQDLFYRLNVFTVNIPPLREREGDRRSLTQHFVQKLSLKLGKEISRIQPEVYEQVEVYHWPGNVRELENVLEQAINLVEGDTLFTEHLPAHINPGPVCAKMERGIISLAALERRAIEDALEKFAGNVSRAAQALGIGRNTLYEKMRKYGNSR